MALDWQKIQEKWQKAWEKAEVGKAKVQKSKDKFFMIFAYPGISGFLHVGHMRGFSYTDAICRYERMRGKEVLFPVGTHASGNQVIAFAQKVKNKDPDWLAYLRKNGCPEKMIPELANPQKVIDYFNKVYVEEYWKKFGFLCDWERFTCTTFSDYQKFIQWQFKKLMQKNLLLQKPYYGTACIKCGPVAVDPSETDISKGGNAEKIEYTLLKFKLGKDYLVAATLRPETIYGQTNLWINPKTTYVRAMIDEESWILSRPAAEKLIQQKDSVSIQENITPSALIGKQVFAPGIDKEIIVLPAVFCDPVIGTGIVTSVPSDAPYDYLALKLLQENTKELQTFHLDPQQINAIKPIPIITTKGYGPFPAQEIIEKYQIISFADKKLEEENKEIYRTGHHTGVMNANCGEYAGKKVEEAKELIKAELIEQGLADIFHDLSEEVICRCGNPVFIQKIPDQWFIRYSDAELTERSKEQVKEMNIYPLEFQQNLPAILDWFSDRACARLGNWMGTKLPFDPRWTIEPISDSTLYPAYYLVSHHLRQKIIREEELTEEFFDYVFLGKGKGKEHWKPIHAEFSYFYPLDLNLGGKEHQTVHFPVFIMNHVAILPEEKWPKGIFVNWWVTGKGSKISKSKGGAEPIPEAIQKYGVDAMRLYYAHIGSPHVDVMWEEETVFHYKQALERIDQLVSALRQAMKKKETREKKERKEEINKEKRMKRIDTWLLSRVHRHLLQVQVALQSYNLRELASTTYFAFAEDVRWYLRRGGENERIIKEAIDIWCRLMNPLTPHLSEELYQGKQLVSLSSWPEPEQEKIHSAAEAGEELVRATIESMRTILKLASLSQAKTFYLFIAEAWKYSIIQAIAKELQVTRNAGEIIKRVLADETVKIYGKEIVKLVTTLTQDPSKIPLTITSSEDELQALTEAKIFLEKEMGCPVVISKAEESISPKAKQALPGKVGILAE